MLAGCPESPPSDTPGDAGLNTTQQGSQPTGEPIDGTVEPPPEGEGAGGNNPSSSSFAVKEGKGVEISGSARYGGEQGGTWRLDVLDLPDEGAPGLLLSQSIPDGGAFSFTAPQGYGEVHLVAFVDIDGDGPSGTDPAGTIAVEIEGADIDGLSISLSDEPDLGKLTPNMPGPHSGAGAPPPEGEPPEGERPPEDGEAPPDPDPDAAPPDSPIHEPAPDDPPLGHGAEVPEDPAPLPHGTPGDVPPPEVAPEQGGETPPPDDEASE